MSKPEDIPQDVWDVASDIFNGKYAVEGGLFSESYVAPMARAILAAKAEEREAIAKFIFDAPAEVSHPAGPLYGAGYSAAVQMMCIAIRKHVDVNTAHKISGVE